MPLQSACKLEAPSTGTHSAAVLFCASGSQSGMPAAATAEEACNGGREGGTREGQTREHPTDLWDLQICRAHGRRPRPMDASRQGPCDTDSANTGSRPAEGGRWQISIVTFAPPAPIRLGQ